MLRKPTFGDEDDIPKLIVTKEEVKQLNDETDLQLEQDKGIHQRFAAVLEQYEQNPDLSFLKPLVNDQTLFEEKQEHAKEGMKKWVTFRKENPLRSPAHSESQPSVIENDNDDDDEELTTLNQSNALENDIKFEIKRNTELLLNLNTRQREIQEKLENAYAQRDNDGIDNPRIDQFTRQLNDLIVPIQVLCVANSGLKISLGLVQKNDIKRTLVAEPNHEVNNNNNAIEQVDPSYKRK